MRLIDADALVKRMNDVVNNFEYVGGFANFAMEGIRNEVQNQPTAYDVDKVIEQLSCESCADCLLMENCRANLGDGFMEKIKEIVKAGGINE